jgi:hypothetical protein
MDDEEGDEARDVERDESREGMEEQDEMEEESKSSRFDPKRFEMSYPLKMYDTRLA